MSKHTPGPWKVSSYSSELRGWYIKAEDAEVPYTILTVWSGQWLREGTAKANAELAAAAPTLLEALEQIAATGCIQQSVSGFHCDDFPEDPRCPTCTARAALAKARGDQ